MMMLPLLLMMLLWLIPYKVCLIELLNGGGESKHRVIALLYLPLVD
jgi:hypothetical protein